MFVNVLRNGVSSNFFSFCYYFMNFIFKMVLFNGGVVFEYSSKLFFVRVYCGVMV